MKTAIRHGGGRSASEMGPPFDKELAMRSRDFQFSDDNDEFVESTGNRPRAAGPQHSSRKQFSYARARKRTTHFNGIHRRRANKWSW